MRARLRCAVVLSAPGSWRGCGDGLPLGAARIVRAIGSGIMGVLSCVSRACVALLLRAEKIRERLYTPPKETVPDRCGFFVPG